MNLLNQYFLALFVTGIIQLLLALFVLFRNIKNRINQTYALYSGSIAVWAIFEAFGITSYDKDMALFFWRLNHMGVIFITIGFVHFVYCATDIQGIKRRLISLSYITGFIFAALNTTNLLILEVVPKFSFRYFINPGKVYYLFFASWCIWMAHGLFELFKAYFNSPPGSFKRNQLKYFSWSMLIAYIGGVPNFFPTFNIQIPILMPFGTYAVAIYAFFTVYAIVKYRLMDIRVALTRTGVFVAVYTFVLGLPFAVSVWMRSWLIDILGSRWWIAPLGLMAALATVGPFIYIYVERKAEERLLREQRRYQQTLKQASIGMTRIRNLRRLLDLIAHIVTRTVRISYAAIYLYNRQSNEYILQISRDKGRMPVPKLDADNPLIAWITVKREPLIYDEIKRQMQDSNNQTLRHLEENMRLLTASVVIPSFLEDKFMGFFVLGDKLAGQIYTTEDLDVFQVLASQAALAIENAQFYEEAKEMQEQISQAEKMATIGTMADGLSHQINNRFYALSLIAGDTLDTIKTTDTSRCTPEVKTMIGEINHALERIQVNVLQGGEVVKGILKYTRKGEEGFEPLSLDQIIDGTLEMVQYKIKLSEIDLIRGYSAGTPKIKANLVQLQEAFFNFIDNAYDAINERRSLLKEEGYRGRITISAQPKNNTLEVTIEDNGIGIKEEDLKKVFTPFFTTKASSRKGTGLGLYVIKRIISGTHQGRINFESAWKIGTRFILELPTA